MVTVNAGAAEGGSATILPADASETDTGHQVPTDSAETEININVTRPPRPAGSYSVTLNKTTATVNLSAGASPVAYHLAGEAAEFTVTRDQALDTPLDVHLTMTQTQSFLPSNKLSQRVRIAANQTTGTLSLDDTDLTGGATSNGKLTASIASNAAYSIGADASKSIDLIAADPVIAVRPASANQGFLENAGTVEVDLVAEAAPGVSIPSSLNFSVSAQTEQGTATRAVDYSDLSATTVSFAASDFAAQDGRQIASKSVSVSLIDDSDQEGDEHFFLRAIAYQLPGGVSLTQHDGTTCSSICDFRVNILDDDSPPPQVTGLVLTPGGGSLVVDWTQVSGADSYKVQWKSGSETFADVVDDGRQAVISSGSTTSHTIPSLTDGTTYTVRVNRHPREFGRPSVERGLGKPRQANALHRQRLRLGGFAGAVRRHPEPGDQQRGDGRLHDIDQCQRHRLGGRLHLGERRDCDHRGWGHRRDFLHRHHRRHGHRA